MKNSLNNRTMFVFAILFLLLSLPDNVLHADSKSGSGVWITGVPEYAEDHILIFRTEKPIAGNVTGNVVFLRAMKDDLAEVHQWDLYRRAQGMTKLRLYGVLLPITEPFPKYHGKLPSFQFIALKMHLPDNPDDLPVGKKVAIRLEDLREQ